MKNKKILPNQLVPKKIRLGVYKEALRLIENNEHKHDLGGFGLCLLLPSILWNLKSFLNDAPNGEDWNFETTSKMFPELENFLSKGIYGHYTDENRIAFLKESINTLSNRK